MNQLSPSSIGISPLPLPHPSLLPQARVRPPPGGGVWRGEDRPVSGPVGGTEGNPSRGRGTRRPLTGVALTRPRRHAPPIRSLTPYAGGTPEARWAGGSLGRGGSGSVALHTSRRRRFSFSFPSRYSALSLSGGRVPSPTPSQEGCSEWGGPRGPFPRGRGPIAHRYGAPSPPTGICRFGGADPRAFASRDGWPPPWLSPRQGGNPPPEAGRRDTPFYPQGLSLPAPLASHPHLTLAGLAPRTEVPCSLREGECVVQAPGPWAPGGPQGNQVSPGLGSLGPGTRAPSRPLGEPVIPGLGSPGHGTRAPRRSGPPGQTPRGPEAIPIGGLGAPGVTHQEGPSSGSLVPLGSKGD